MFYLFENQQQRRECGGSNFIEFQFCHMPAKSAIKEIVSVDNIQHWKNDSLYVNDENAFYQQYSCIFDCGIYNDLQTGTVDIYGINYYPPSVIEKIIEKLNHLKPTDYEILIDWLEKSKNHNGFYILGV